MPFREALRLLSDACAEAVFQPETPEMPVQILEALQRSEERRVGKEEIPR